MSLALMSRAWQAPTRQALKLLLLALADHADSDAVCWPSIESLCAKCSTDRRTLFRQLAELERLGHISRESRRGHSTIYRVHPKNETAEGVAVEPPVALNPPVGVDTQRGGPETTGGVVVQPPTRGSTPTQNHQEPSLKRKRTVRARAAKAAFVFPPWVPMDGRGDPGRSQAAATARRIV